MPTYYPHPRMGDDLLEGIALACPRCHAPLMGDEDLYSCTGCANAYPVREGIPILITDESLAEHDEIDHDQPPDVGRGARSRQARHFDQDVASEFEIERPHGAPRLYDFLLREKFRRATGPISDALAGATALTVCGGSGMDAEFLAEAGARVVASDISFGAARRTVERARRHNVDIRVVVADVSRLPFADGSFDLVLVHDGLHHLERPHDALAEMARVARRWVSITEPARATATALAVRGGLALEYEAAGNRVFRFTQDEIASALGTAGFRALNSTRYAMYYPHTPGRVFRILSSPFVFPFVRSAWRVATFLFGRGGNKLAVVAERHGDKTQQWRD